MKNVITIVLIMLASSCSKDKSNLDFNSTQPTSQNDGEMTFADLQKEIIVPHCIRCNADYSHESELKKEIKPGDAEASHLFAHIRDGSMPPDRAPLGAAELEMVRMYIDNLHSGPTGEDNDDHDHP